MDSSKRRSPKTNKAKVPSKQNRLQKITSCFFKFVEISVVLVSVAKFAFHLFISLKSSSEHIKDFTVVLVNPHLVFVVGNTIIVALLVKSGLFSCQDSCSKYSSDDLYTEFLETRERKQESLQDEVENREEQNISEQSTSEKRGKQSTSEKRGKQSTSEKRGKQSTSENSGKQSTSEKRGKQSTSEKRGKQSTSENSGQQSTSEKSGKQSTSENRGKQSITEIKSYRRTQSENFTPVKVYESCCQKLRRSETENFLESFGSEEKAGGFAFPEDRMSSEEFRDKIEAFIARQRRLQKDEEISVFQ